jgi:hypothetical protein
VLATISSACNLVVNVSVVVTYELEFIDITYALLEVYNVAVLTKTLADKLLTLAVNEYTLDVVTYELEFNDITYALLDVYNVAVLTKLLALKKFVLTLVLATRPAVTTPVLATSAFVITPVFATILPACNLVVNDSVVVT